MVWLSFQPVARLKIDDFPVLGNFVFNFSRPAEHIIIHMRQDESFRLNFGQMFFQRLEIVVS